MKNIIRRCTAKLYKKSYYRKYEFTQKGLRLFITLKPRSQLLLTDILALTSKECNIQAVTVEFEIEDVGFPDYNNFRKYRKDITDSGLMFYKHGRYYVNPFYINYYSRRQSDYFFKLFKLRKEITVNLGDFELRKVD